MSKILSVLGVNGLGFGALKFGGAENEKSDLDSSLVLTEPFELSEDWAIDFTKKTLLFLESLWTEIGRRIGAGETFRTPAMVFRRSSETSM